MIRVSPSKQQGIALIQVIITTSIIMLLMIFFLGAAKNQVARAQALQDKTTAYLSYYSAKNLVLYELLTRDKNELQGLGWNYHGVPFKVNDHTTVAIQDLNGLLSLATTTSTVLIKRILEQTLPVSQAQTVAASLVDWIDADNDPRADGAEQSYYSGWGIVARNAPIQTFTELAFINGMSVEAEALIIANSTVHPTPYFNPMTAPQAFLSAYMEDPFVASDVIRKRKGRGYNRKVVEESTQLYAEDGIDYLVGPGFRLTVHSKVAESFFGKILEYGVYPYRKRPIEVLSRLPRQQLSR